MTLTSNKALFSGSLRVYPEKQTSLRHCVATAKAAAAPAVKAEATLGAKLALLCWSHTAWSSLVMALAEVWVKPELTTASNNTCLCLPLTLLGIGRCRYGSKGGGYSFKCVKKQK